MRGKFELQDLLECELSFQLLDSLKKNPLMNDLNYSEFNLMTWELGCIASALLRSPSITSLTLGRCKMNNETVEILLKNPFITSLTMKFPLQDMDSITLDAYTRLVRETTFITSFDSLFPDLSQLDNEILDSEGIQSLIDAIKFNKSITLINLISCDINDKFGKKIAEIIQENKSITALNFNKSDEFNHKNIQEDDWIVAIADALKKNTSITSFNFVNNCITDNPIKVIAKALKNHTSITDLDLQLHEITDAGAEAMAEALQENTVIKKLLFWYNHINAQGEIAILSALKKNQSITDLDLFRACNLSNEGAIILAKAINSNKYKSLAIAVSEKNAEVIAQAIAENTSISLLNLSHGDSDCKCINAIAKAIEKNNAITSLELKLVMKMEGAIVLAQAIKNNTSITSLDLSDNFIDGESAEALAQAIKENSSITSLVLFNNEIGDEGAEAFAQVIKDNASITLLDLSCNYIGKEGLEAVVKALEGNCTITKLLFENYSSRDSISPELITKLSDLLKRNEQYLIDKRFFKTKIASFAHFSDGFYNHNKKSKRPQEFESLEECSASKKQKVNEESPVGVLFCKSP